MFGIPENVLITIISIAIGIIFVLGVPIFLCMSTWVILVSPVLHFTLENVGMTSYQGISGYALLALPMFILTGDLIGAGGIAQKLATLARRVLAPVGGGLAMATIAACAAFAAISGSNAATVATIGRIMMPELESQGYDKTFSAATIAAGGIVGILIPPSILMIIYGYSTNISVLDLFKAGILPGLLVTFALIGASRLWSYRYKWGSPKPFQINKVLVGIWDAKFGLIAVLLLFYVIYGGVCSPTEASGIVAFYCLLVGVLVVRQIKVKQIPATFLESGHVIGMIAPIVAISVVLQQVFSIMGLQAMASAFIFSFKNYYVMLGAMMLFVVVGGMIMESIPICIILSPIFAPIAVSMGINPIHFAMIFIVGLSIGFITPPFGINLFVSEAITGIPYLNLLRWIPPYLILTVIAWIIVMLFPWLSLVFV